MAKNVPFIGYMQPVDPNAIQQQPGYITTTTIYLPDIMMSDEDIRKGKTMENLFHVGVVFKHKNSKVLWEIVEVQKDEDGLTRLAVAKSRNSGYRKAIWPSPYSYDTFELVDAPKAVLALFGDKKHADSATASEAPKMVEDAFEDLDLEQE